MSDNCDAARAMFEEFAIKIVLQLFDGDLEEHEREDGSCWYAPQEGDLRVVLTELWADFLAPEAIDSLFDDIANNGYLQPSDWPRASFVRRCVDCDREVDDDSHKITGADRCLACAYAHY